MFERLRAHFHARDGYWFVPKMFGFGVTPVTWQGWAATLAFLGALIATIRRVPGEGPRIAICIALFAAFGVLAAYKTEGGLGWHWGLGRKR